MEPATASDGEQPAIGLGTMLAYSAASFGAGAFYFFHTAALPLFLRTLTASDVLIGLVSSIRPLTGAVVQPFVGAWSDRLHTPLGRRRPFFLVGIPLAATILALTPFAPSLAWVVVAILVCSLFFNVVIDPYNALLADIAPVSQRATLSSLATVVQFGGQVGINLLVAWLGERGIPPEAFVLVAAVLVLSFAVTVVGVPEPRDAQTRRQVLDWREYVASLAAYREAQKFFVGLFVVFFGLNAVVPFLTLYAVNEIGVSEGEALRLVLVMVVVVGALAVPFGRLGDRGEITVPGTGGRLRIRVGPAPAYRRLLAFGIVCLGGAAVLGTLATDLVQLVALEVLAGVGLSALTVLWWPLLTTLIPRERSGVFAGLSATVQSLALPVSVALAGWLIDLFGTYRVAFAILAVAAVVALAVFVWLSPPGGRTTSQQAAA